MTKKSFKTTTKHINAKDIKTFGPGSPPRDDKLIKILELAYQDKIPVHKALIRRTSIKPHSDFKPDLESATAKHFREKVKEEKYPYLHVYVEGDDFIMSDDYYGYYAYLAHGYEVMPCVVLGEFNHDNKGVMGKPNKIKLELPTYEVIDES